KLESVTDLSRRADRLADRWTGRWERQQQCKETDEPLLVDQERIARLAARVERGRRGACSHSHGGSIFVQWRRRRGEGVAIHGFDRRHALEQEVDARAPGLALVALLDPP